MRERRQMNVVRFQQPTSPPGPGQHQPASIDDVDNGRGSSLRRPMTRTKTPIYLLSAESDERTTAIEQKIRALIPELVRIENMDGIAQNMLGKTKGLIYV